MNRLALALALIVTAIALTGCGGDTATRRRPSAIDALLDRLPAKMTDITVLDVAAARRKLRVAAAVDPIHGAVDDPANDQRYRAALSTPLSYLSEPTAVMRSIDHRRLTAVVHARATGLGDEVLILATPQAPAEIERGLRRAGRAPVGTDVYALKTGDAGADLDDLDTMAFGHGLVVLASSAGVARGVLRRTAPEPRLKAELALADSVGGDMRTVSIGAPISDDAQCIHALAGGERFDKGDQKLVLVLGERPSSRRVVLDQGVNDQDILSAGYDVRDVQVDGRTITLTLRVTSDTLGLTSAASIADGDLPAQQVYRCLGSPAPKPAQAPSAATTPTGTQLERSIALYVAAGSLAPNLVRVHCPPGSSRADRNVHCTGTRADRGRTYHYVITAHFSPGGHFLAVDIDSKDDRTKTIV